MGDSFFELLLTLVYPHKCFCCGKVLVGTGYLCAGCGQTLPLTGGVLCVHCGKHTDACMCERLAVPTDAVQCMAPLYYTDAIAHGIHRFKYEGRQYYADFLAELMEGEVRRNFTDGMPDAITYVPMHRKKERQRGFCPTRLLAKKLSTRLDLPVRDSLLLHTGQGCAQMELDSFEERMENARSVYRAVGRARLEGSSFLLVDDVLTTGCTAHRCAQLLLEQGAEQVYILVAATTGNKHKALPKTHRPI